MDYTPLPATVPADCPDIHPDDFPLIDAANIPELYVDAALAWRDALATDRDAVRALAELLWDLTWKASAQ